MGACACRRLPAATSSSDGTPRRNASATHGLAGPETLDYRRSSPCSSAPLVAGRLSSAGNRFAVVDVGAQSRRSLAQSGSSTLGALPPERPSAHRGDHFGPGRPVPAVDRAQVPSPTPARGLPQGPPAGTCRTSQTCRPHSPDVVHGPTRAPFSRAPRGPGPPMRDLRRGSRRRRDDRQRTWAGVAQSRTSHEPGRRWSRSASPYGQWAPLAGRLQAIRRQVTR